jgi:hypothetical protein
MMRGPLPLLAYMAVAVTGCALGSCGSSDEDEIRDVSKVFLGALSHKDGGRACELMTTRASVQLRASFAAFQDATGNCENIVSNTRPDGTRAHAAAVGKARLTVRDDRAVLRFRGDADPLGLRRVDDSWRVDNLLNPRVDETPRRPDPLMTKGSDATQIRATLSALDGAFSTRDYRRVCDLISPGVEAPLLINVIFIRAFTDRDPSDVSCAAAFKQLEQAAERRGMARRFDRLFELGPVRSRRGTPKVSIRDDGATVRAGRFTNHMIKLDGRWLLDADPAPSATPAQFAFCWKSAGARIASDASDLRFAAADKRPEKTRAHGRVSVKGDDWRIFYVLSADGADPGLARVLSDPLAVSVIAYVRDAASHPKVVRNARRCGD